MFIPGMQSQTWNSVMYAAVHMNGGHNHHEPTRAVSGQMIKELREGGHLIVQRVEHKRHADKE